MGIWNDARRRSKEITEAHEREYKRRSAEQGREDACGIARFSLNEIDRVLKNVAQTIDRVLKANPGLPKPMAPFPMAGVPQIAATIDDSISQGGPRTIEDVVTIIVQKILEVRHERGVADLIELGAVRDSVGEFELFLDNAGGFQGKSETGETWDFPLSRALSLQDPDNPGHYTRLLRLLLERYVHEKAVSAGLIAEQ